MPAPDPHGTEERTARISFRRPEHWTREPSPGADLRLTGDSATVTVRSRPSDISITDESTALFGRLPGAEPDVFIIGCDVWDGAGAPARLVEYARSNDGTTLFASHLLIATGRNRIDVVVERPVTALASTDAVVFDLLESVRVVGAVTGGRSAVLETLPERTPARMEDDGPLLDAAALAALQALAGHRWAATTLRTPGGRALVEAGLIGRLGTVPSETGTILAPWSAGVEPVTLEQASGEDRRSRLQLWVFGGAATVLDGTEDTGYRVRTLPEEAAVRLLAERLELTPTWTWPFQTTALPSALLEQRLGGTRVPLPDTVATDEVLAAFWAEEWTVSSLRRPSRPRPSTIVGAGVAGFARVLRANDEAGTTAFRVEAPANLYRLIVSAVLS